MSDNWILRCPIFELLYQMPHKTHWLYKTKQEVMAKINQKKSIWIQMMKTTESSIFLRNFSSNTSNEYFYLCLSKKWIDMQFTAPILAKQTCRTHLHWSLNFFNFFFGGGGVKLGIFCLELGKNTYFLALGMEPNFGPKIGWSRALKSVDVILIGHYLFISTTGTRHI